MNGGRSAPKWLSASGHRPLTPDDERLWSLITHTVRPLRQGKKPAVDARLKAGFRDPTRPIKDKSGSEANVAVSRQRPVSPSSLSPIPRREKQKLARGNMAIDARVDLHGMTQAEAYTALQRHLHRSQANGAKFVLVITGKGVPAAFYSERGVLRRQVPIWLSLPEFRRYVLGFDTADAGHGGEGALYVRLKRARV
jgi:DNA-nicking Smr family endonuclease